jgi:hypothetical protein
VKSRGSRMPSDQANYGGCIRWLPFKVSALKQILSTPSSHDTEEPNVVVKWLALMLCIRVIPGSDLSLETGYHHWDFSWFSSVTPGKCRDCPLKLGQDCFLPNSFPFIINLSPFHLTVYNLSYWKSVVK